VQNSGAQHSWVPNATLGCQNVRQRNGVIDIRRGVSIFSPLMPVLFGCEKNRSCEYTNPGRLF
jgi:hypothetical protein